MTALVEPSLSTRGGEQAGQREKNMPFSWALFQQILNFHISRSHGVLLSVSLVKNPSGNTISALEKKIQLDVNHNRIILELEMTSEIILL